MTVSPTTIPAHPSLLPPDDASPARTTPRARFVVIPGEGSDHEAPTVRPVLRTA